MAAASVAVIFTVGVRVAVAQAPTAILLSPEGNRLNAYDVTTFAKQTVIRNASDGDEPGEGGSDTASEARDINGEICVDPSHPRRIISGEDTGQPDPPAGWGYIEISGYRLGELTGLQIGKLTPTYLGKPDNFGCGFRPDGTLVTTAIGDVFPHEPANGELILWYPPFDAYAVRYCKLYQSLGTAGGIAVAADGTVYVATNRPDQSGMLGGVYRVTGDFPTSDDAEGGCGRSDAQGAPLVDAGRLAVEVFIPSDVHVTTVSDVLMTARDTFVVSSVFTGIVAEYAADGSFLRRILEPPGGLPTGQLNGITPFGLAEAPDSAVFVADLGIQGDGPVAGEGSVVRVAFDSAGDPVAPEIVDEGLTFPDGLGVMLLGPTTPAAPVESPVPAPSPGGAPAPSPRTAPQAGELPRTGGGAALASAAGVAAAWLSRRAASSSRAPSRR